jgi:hypothetical protein
MDNKKINIVGVNNKYQVKKLTENKNEERKKRKISVKYDIFDNNMDYLKKQQEIIIRTYKKEKEENEKEEKEEKEEEYNILIKSLIEKEIKKKINGYKNQDIIKKKFNIEKFVKFDDTMEMLYSCDLNCYYCKDKVFLLYDFVREIKQWTLDRIDNNMGHEKDNILISCLECNLKRKNINKDSFLFTKELKIIKSDLSIKDDRMDME